ncbi:prominin-1-A-like [Diorhabda sublineata]|uniref:prominin-1-A-like n=1 Tax=Diorhabda sublineata TaxID=1163346 RepID=UPI0024E10BB6|nr:prominin-1-A-like [Diorhabda sublineata]
MIKCILKIFTTRYRIVEMATVEEDNFDGLVPNYTDYIDNHNYLSGSVTFSPVGMAGIYQLTTDFINSIFPENIIEEGTFVWKKDIQNTYYLELKDGLTYKDVIEDYWCFIYILAFILAIAIFLPIVGLIVCCCRCCGNCGGKARPSNKRKELGAKIILAVLLTICLGFFVFGMVGSFASNQQLRKGTNEFPENGRKVYADSQSFLYSIKDQAEHLLKNNYEEFGDAFKDFIQDSGKNIIEQLSVWANASSILRILNFAETLPELKNNLENLSNFTSNLITRETDLEEGMEGIKKNLIETLNKCSEEFKQECMEVEEAISSLAINVDFNKLPDVSQALQLIGELDIENIINVAENGKEVLENAEKNINDTISDVLRQISDKIDEAGTEINNNLNTLDDIAENLTSQFHQVNETIENGYGYLYEYYPYFYYSGVTLCCVLLSATVFSLLGLVFGVFGRRPERSAGDCCTKRSGSLCLMSAAVAIFAFSFICGPITVAMMVSGVAADRVVCYPLRDPEHSTILHLLDDYPGKIRGDDLNYTVGEGLLKCYDNRSIYSVLNLESKFDLSQLDSKFDVTNSLENIREQIGNRWSTFFPDDFEILNETSQGVLEELTKIDPDVDVDSFRTELSKSVVNMDLESVVTSLELLADGMSSRDPQVADGLEKIIEDIKTYEETILEPTMAEARQALELAIIVDGQIKMNSSSMSAAITQFIEDVEFAQNQLKNSDISIEGINKYIDKVEEIIRGYLRRVITVLTEELGQCGPLNVAIHALLIAVCDKITLPWNSFWMSMLICLIASVPMIIFSIWLSSLYKRYKPREQNNERSRLRNSIGKRYNDYYPEQGNDDTIPIGMSNYYGEVFKKNKNVDYYQGASAPKALDDSNYRYNDMSQRLNQYPQQSTRF